MSNTKLTIFNNLFEEQISEKQYEKGHKKTKEETKETLKRVVMLLHEQVGNKDIFDGEALMERYNNKNISNKELIDRVAEFVLDSTLKSVTEVVENIIGNQIEMVAVKGALLSSVESTVEQCIVDNKHNDGAYLGDQIRRKLFEEINSDHGFYKVHAAELFLGTRITDKGSLFILDFNYDELVRYMKVNAHEHQIDIA